MAKVKGSQVRIKPIPVMKNCILAPKNALKTQKCVTLAADAFFINEILFILTYSRNLCFLACKFLENHTGMQLCKPLTKMALFHKNRSFVVQHLLADPELECLKPKC